MSRATQVQLREDETLFSAEDLRKVIWQETQKRVWELEREPASLSMHSRTWEDLLIQEAQPGEVSYNHFRGILVIRDGRIPYGHVSIAWKKPA